MNVRAANQDGLDASSIKPVSSLRSKFEDLQKHSPIAKPLSGPQVARQEFLGTQTMVTGQRPRTSGGGTIPDTADNTKGVLTSMPREGLRPIKSNTAKSRPQSMISFGHERNLPPTVTIDVPRAPEMATSLGWHVANINGFIPDVAEPSSVKSHARTLSRSAMPILEARGPKLMSATNGDDPYKHEIKIMARPSNGPPAVNRAAKPKLVQKPSVLPQQWSGLTATGPTHAELIDHSISPFNTPPSSRRNSPEALKDQTVQRPRNESDASWVERLRSDSAASPTHNDRNRTDSNVSFGDRTRTASHASFVESLPYTEGLSQGPSHPAVMRKHRALDSTAQGNSVHPSAALLSQVGTANDELEPRPRLPARPALQLRSGRPSPSQGRRSPGNPGKDSPKRFSADGEILIPKRERNMDFRRTTPLAERSPSPRSAAPKPTHTSVLTQGFTRDSSLRVAPEVPAPRRSLDRRPNINTISCSPPRIYDSHTSGDVAAAIPLDVVGETSVGASDFPDMLRSSRRPPRFTARPHHLATEYDTRLMVTCGEYVCTTGYITKVWNLRTGAQLLSFTHHEGTRVTSLVFKPTSAIEDEGKRIWLGTSAGDIHEIDVPSQTLVKTKLGAHTRREIIRMFRYTSELWTLDDGGDLNIWKPDHKGMPSLDSQFTTFRVPKGISIAIACGKHIWIAYGKELRVFQPDARSDSEFQVLRAPLVQPGIGDITAGTTLSSRPDLVYFGHLDGKISIYSRQDFSCVSVVNISPYKISTLTGIGAYIWAGYSTGMMYVYDPSTVPWTVKKDWQAHEKQICGVSADPSTLWKLNRMQVVSLGTDNMVRLWDGLLEEDWLDARMLAHDSEYCTFRELSIAVLTWNAGASKPYHLQASMDDSNFLYEYLSTGRPADILCFGFQELVDLEDKKVTAKSFFKSKKRDAGEPEHMSHQYRVWRDHLTKCVDDFTGPNENYTLLHTASMVGLFSCIFVKSSERSHIKHVHNAEVKRGMGGLHGNKGALVVRMVLDDSSLCLVNCHLAAGQTQTINRNNDIAAILEAEALPAYPLGQNSRAQHSDVFTGGGSGSMILDHEICILNGDLNYRIDTMSRDTVVKHIASHNLVRLLERDQLLLSRKKNPGFRLRAFTESPITFAPTYKYNVHSDDYDTSEKRRAPAWCDRILYRGIEKVKMEDETYRRWEVRVSDHRPVSGRLRLRVKPSIQSEGGMYGRLVSTSLRPREPELHGTFSYHISRMY